MELSSLIDSACSLSQSYRDERQLMRSNCLESAKCIRICDDLTFGSLWDILSHFVFDMCNKDRPNDESHGFLHMQEVALDSLVLCHLRYGPIADQQRVVIYKIVLCCLVAWFHDLGDHKYDKDGIIQVKVDEFVRKVLAPMLYRTELFTEDLDEYRDKVTCSVRKIIERISYSKELISIVEQRQEWFGCLTPMELEVRDIVSDADKLAAIGAYGVKRCILYRFITRTSTCTDVDIYRSAVEHCDIKLLKLYPTFIRTEQARSIACKLHKEMRELVEQLKEHLDGKT